MSSLLLKTLHAWDLFRFADQCRVQKFSDLESINMNLKKCIEGKKCSHSQTWFIITAKTMLDLFFLEIARARNCHLSSCYKDILYTVYSSLTGRSKIRSESSLFQQTGLCFVFKYLEHFKYIGRCHDYYPL